MEQWWNIYTADGEWTNLTPREGMAQMRALQVQYPEYAPILETAARLLFAGEEVCFDIGNETVYVEVRDWKGRYVNGERVLDEATA